MSAPRLRVRMVTQFIPVILLSFTLFGCDALFPPKEEPVPVAAPPVKHIRTAKAPKASHYQPDVFVQHFTLARLAAAAYTNNTSAVAGDLDILQAYMAQQPRDRAYQPVLVLDYTTNGAKALQQVIAPIAMPTDKSEFPDLLEIMNNLSTASYTLNDIRLATVTLSTSDMVSLNGDSVAHLRQSLDQQQQRLLGNAQKFLPLDNARELLQLTRFFMEHRFRDAAYLAVENVKQELALASQDSSANADVIKNLSHELEALESQLHKTLPFTLSAR